MFRRIWKKLFCRVKKTKQPQKDNSHQLAIQLIFAGREKVPDNCMCKYGRGWFSDETLAKVLCCSELNEKEELGWPLTKVFCSEPGYHRKIDGVYPAAARDL